MTDDEILGLIQETLCSIAPDQSARFRQVTLATQVKQLDIDSIATMEMIGRIEDSLAATFDEHDLAHVTTLGDLANLIRGMRTRR